TARIDNIYFLARVGSSLRWAAQGVRPEDLSSDVKHMLERLDQPDALAQRLSRPNNDRACTGPARPPRTSPRAACRTACPNLSVKGTSQNSVISASHV